jgi:PAS domain S-box-containing protein
MAVGFLQSRMFAAGALFLCAITLALLWEWQSGWIIAGATSVVLLDGLARLRRGSVPRVMFPLLLDVTATGSAVLFTDLPHMVVVAPFFYILVSAGFALSRRASLVVTVFAAAWSLAIVRFDPIIVDTSLNANQQGALAAIAVVVYLGATFLMTNSAAIAVRDRERLNADLRENELRLQTVVESTPIVLYAIDNNGVFTLSEGPGLRLLGLEPGEVVGLHFNDVYNDNQEILDMVGTALSSDTDTVAEVTVGETAFAVHHRPQINSKGIRTGTVGVAIDVTAEATYRRELENQIRSKDEFIAAVSHELRTPLSVVYGLGEELRSNSADLTPGEIDELHTLLAQQAGEVVAIVEDLLVAARADIDRLVVVRGPVDIGRQVASVVQPMMAASPVEVVAADVPVVAWCDGPRCRQILRNLVTNATRHGGDHIRLSYGYADGRVLIEVRDDGIGVPTDEESLIFDAYHRAPAATGNPASIGLGLTVARKLAQLMDGDLSYDRLDGWSVFSLTLPSGAGR